jgi:hypothetical protein
MQEAVTIMEAQAVVKGNLATVCSRVCQATTIQVIDGI